MSHKYIVQLMDKRNKSILTMKRETIEEALKLAIAYGAHYKLEWGTPTIEQNRITLATKTKAYPVILITEE